MLGQVTVDSEGDLTVVALEGARVVGTGGTERQVHVHLIKVAGRALVFLQVSAGAEGDSARHAAERSFHVVDVHVQRQLRGPCELLVAHTAAAPAILRGWTIAGRRRHNAARR